MSLRPDRGERDRAERLLRESEERQAFFLKLSDALRPLDDPAQVKLTATRLLGEQLTVSRVFYADAQDGHWLVTKGYETGVAPLPDRPFALSEYGDWIIEGFRSGRRLVVNDMRTDVRFAKPEREAHLALRIGAEVALPLVKGGKLLAMLVAHDASPREWSEREIATLEEAAERTWAAVERARAEIAERQAHALLERRVQERTADLARANASLEAEIHERRAAETQIKALFSRLVLVQEDERRRIAREIHDQLGQQMTALRMNLETWRFKSSGNPAVVEQAERTQRLAEALDQSIDFLTWQLRPATLDHFGLAAALRNLITGWSERFGVTAEFDVAGDDVRLAPDVESNIYRLVQEALHNVVKHAHATHLTVSLTAGDDELVLVIEDNGRGFDRASTLERRGSGLGLVSMRERAMLIGGQMEIESSPGAGTVIVVRVPR